MVICAVGILVLAWRLPADIRTVAASAVGLVCGFGIVGLLRWEVCSQAVNPLRVKPPIR
jgi:hypothetical protein